MREQIVTHVPGLTANTAVIPIHEDAGAHLQLAHAAKRV